MRIVKYPSVGKPSDRVRDKLDELLMFAEAAISVTNVRRWAQQEAVSKALARADGRADGVGFVSMIPDSLRESGKRNQYEVSVVDEFISLGAQSFAFNGTEAIWERPLRTGARGRPVAIDVALFNSERSEESRVEFGMFAEKKLRDDAQKLIDYAGTQVVAASLTNYIVLWRESPRASHTAKRASEWKRKAASAADDANPKLRGGQVNLLMTTTQDVFAPVAGPHWIQVALYEVIPVQAEVDSVVSVDVGIEGSSDALGNQVEVVIE